MPLLVPSYSCSHVHDVHIYARCTCARALPGLHAHENSWNIPHTRPIGCQTTGIYPAQDQSGVRRRESRNIDLGFMGENPDYFGAKH
eukprot:1194474-Prorocentrum_minimum.AAC.7